MGVLHLSVAQGLDDGLRPLQVGDERDARVYPPGGGCGTRRDVRQSYQSKQFPTCGFSPQLALHRRAKLNLQGQASTVRKAKTRLRSTEGWRTRQCYPEPN